MKKATSLLLLVLLAGCAGQASEPSQYLLRSAHEPQSRKLTPSKVYSVGRVTIASYIDQPGLVLETAAGEIHAARAHLWAEPVYEGVRQYLTADIARAWGEDILPDSVVKTPVVIDIHIDQLHGTSRGTARLVAYWSLRRDGRLAAAHQFAEEQALGEAGYRALVAAEDELLTRLAGAIAESLPAAASE